MTDLINRDEGDKKRVQRSRFNGKKVIDEPKCWNPEHGTWNSSHRLAGVRALVSEIGKRGINSDDAETRGWVISRIV
jgi:hypothetical protein